MAKSIEYTITKPAKEANCGRQLFAANRRQRLHLPARQSGKNTGNKVLQLDKQVADTIEIISLQPIKHGNTITRRKGGITRENER